MSRFFLSAFCFTCLLVSFGRLSATQNAEELRIKALYDMISAPNREGKELLLKSFEEGILPLDNSGIMLLKRLAGAGTYFDEASQSDMTDIRIRALSVLGTAGEVGSEIITELIREETDANAMAISFYYLGNAGPANSQRIASMNIAIRRDAMTSTNNNAAQFYLEAVRKVVTTESDQLPLVLDILSIMSSVGYSSEIQKIALQTITQLTRIS